MLPLLLACTGSSPDSTDSAESLDTGTPGTDTATEPFSPPEWCPDTEEGIQEVTTTDASPWFMTHPMTDSLDVPTIIFLSGGPGDVNSAMGGFRNWLDAGSGMPEVRTVIPYAPDGNLTDEYDRTLDILDEVLACWGGDAARVHISGTSNGGRGAYDLMLSSPERFATLLGAPGVFSSASSSALSEALVGKAVYNGVGSEDASWQPYVEQTHEQLDALGIDSVYVEFPGEGHALSPDFDTSVFFDFWLAH